MRQETWRRRYRGTWRPMWRETNGGRWAGAALRVVCAVLLGSAGMVQAQNANGQPDFAAQVMAADPSVYLNFNDATAKFKDAVSGSVFSGVVPGQVAPPNGEASWAVLNGSNDYLSAASALTSNAVFSYAGWVYLPNANMSGAFFSNGVSTNDGASSNGVWVGVGSQAGAPGTGNYLNVLSSAVAWQYSNTQIGTGWHFIVVTRDGTTMRAYIDGVQTPTLANATATPNPPTGGVFMGQASTVAGDQMPWFGGGLSDWKTYNVALTQAQITALYQGTAVTAGMVDEWKLNDGSGTAAADAVTSSDDGTWHGTAPLATGFYGPLQGGSVAVRQPGFDAGQPDNTSAAFAYNAFNAAPNSSMGAIEWNVPYSILVHVDRLNWNRSGQLVLASKGDVSGATNFWELYLQMSGTTSQLCFSRSGGGASNGVCTNSGTDAMPNGFNYDVIVTDTGTGAPGGSYCAGCATPLSLYINGLGPAYIPQTPVSNSYANGFGYVNLAVTGGTGYANSTNFTSTGGGANCSVTGTMLATNGVPTSVTTGTGSNNFGCTSAPAITLVSPTGTGAVITATTSSTSMNAAGLPLLVPGYVSGGTYFGVAGSNAAQTPTNVDEAAVFPGVLSQNEITALFYQTKFYQGLMKAQPQPPLVILSEDGCGDTDNFFALSMLIKAHQIGAVKLIGVESVQNGWENPGFFREELDQAGLKHVPVSVAGYLDSSTTLCPAASLTAYNASIPQSMTVYESSVTMYRTLFAKYSTTPIVVVSGASLAGLVEFMQSAADGISSLTGTQLWAQNANNGGAVYGQGLGENYSFGSYYDAASSEYMFANNMPMPIDWFGGTPQQAGPGVLAARTANDPLWMVFHSLGGDTRSCWDCLPVAAIVSTAFEGGVNVTIGGSGTGYAQYTPFTSTGGGPDCVVTGTMVSVNGVPSSILSSEGTPLNTAVGTGTGCLTAASPPTIVLTNPTGTGAVLTAATTASPCGTITQTTASNGVTSQASCTNEYFIPFSLNALPGATPVFEWFVNSMVDAVPVGMPRRQ